MGIKNKPNVCVVGSINMDFTIITDEAPFQGETVIGEKMITSFGGKGANQAISASRMGSNVHMIGAIGDDSFGEKLLNYLNLEGVITDNIAKIQNEPTGVANVVLTDLDNRIIIIPGANACLTPDMIKNREEVIKKCDVVLLQMEIPLDSIITAIEISEKHDIPVILNPAPYQYLPEEVINKTSFITPNEIEFNEMLQDIDYEKNKHKIIVTKGKKGVCFYENGIIIEINSNKISVVDTTGAGDTFNGVLAAFTASKKSLFDSVYYANIAAALSTTKIGAQSAMPTLKEVESFDRKIKHFSK